MSYICGGCGKDLMNWPTSAAPHQCSPLVWHKEWKGSSELDQLRAKLQRAEGIIRRLVEGRWCTCDKCQQAWSEAMAFLEGKQ